MNHKFILLDISNSQEAFKWQIGAYQYQDYQVKSPLMTVGGENDSSIETGFTANFLGNPQVVSFFNADLTIEATLRVIIVNEDSTSNILYHKTGRLTDREVVSNNKGTLINCKFANIIADTSNSRLQNKGYQNRIDPTDKIFHNEPTQDKKMNWGRTKV